MRDELLRRGVPEEVIVSERASLNTRDNARLTAPLLRARSARRLLLVTQPLHLRRAARAFRGAGLEPRGVFIEGSYQLDPAHVRILVRDVIREAGAGALELLRGPPSRPPER